MTILRGTATPALAGSPSHCAEHGCNAHAVSDSHAVLWAIYDSGTTGQDAITVAVQFMLSEALFALGKGDLVAVHRWSAAVAWVLS